MSNRPQSDPDKERLIRKLAAMLTDLNGKDEDYTVLARAAVEEGHKYGVVILER